MKKRYQLSFVLSALLLSVTHIGCRGHQFAHVVDDNQSDMVGSHSAGAETFNPLIQQAVFGMLAQPVKSFSGEEARQRIIDPCKVCFVGVENKSAEELGDFKEQIYEEIDSLVSQNASFQTVSRRYVDAGLDLSRLRPSELFIPANMREFTAILEREGQPVDYMLFAKLTSGTTQNNRDMQRDYLLTLELVDVRTGEHIKESAKIRKGYHKSRIAKAFKYNPFTRK